jgi:hypothetical protein
VGCVPDQPELGPPWQRRLLGVVLLLIVVVSPRMPWLPTAAVLPLLDGMAATLPGTAMNTLLTGLLTAAAVWGWWSYRRRADRA